MNSGKNKIDAGTDSAGNTMEFGLQPLDEWMNAHGLKNHDLVAASKNGLTYKQVQKGRKGRRLTKNIQDKIAAAVSARTGEDVSVKQLFTYR
ncbi:MAG: hypothetical protein WC959_12680 [Kiritimatiellales bacterium]